MNLLVIVLEGIKQHSAFPTSSPQKCFYSEKKIIHTIKNMLLYQVYGIVAAVGQSLYHF